MKTYTKEFLMAELDLIVIYTHDINALRSFYETLGVSFELEKHGSGKAHYAGQLGELVLELYPTRKEITRTRLGFLVDDIDSVIASIGSRYVDTYSSQDQHAVLRDPDGRKVELRQIERNT